MTVENGAATATERLSGASVSAEEMETLFPGFADAITAPVILPNYWGRWDH